jgi:hypothetical protein
LLRICQVHERALRAAAVEGAVLQRQMVSADPLKDHRQATPIGPFDGFGDHHLTGDQTWRRWLAAASARGRSDDQALGDTRRRNATVLEFHDFATLFDAGPGDLHP